MWKAWWHEGVHAGFLAPSAMPSLVVVQGRPAASRGEAASEESATAAGSAVDMGLQTVGTLDLGGSSLEVTFLPSGTPQQPATGMSSSGLADDTCWTIPQVETSV